MKRPKGTLEFWTVVLVLPATLTGCAGPATRTSKGPAALTVSAAISVKGALDAVARKYEAQHPGVKISPNYGSSGTLEHQIEQGAPVDVFLSAAEKQMDELERENLIETRTRRNVLRNQLVLIVPAREGGVRGFGDLRRGRVKTIAVGEPKTVPAGMYAQQVLEYCKLLPAVRGKLVEANNVRQVLAYVETGNADAGLVYASDAKITNEVRVVAVAPEEAHEPIVYPAAVLKDSQSPAAALRFLDFLSSPVALAVFENYGFEAATGPATRPGT